MRWPQGWDRPHRVALRLALCPVLYPALFVAFLCVWAGWGRAEALAWWRDAAPC